MNYQVIARKYRPQTFADLTGQEHIARTLSQALEHKRLHHAYLFAGVRGTGKTTTARILAKGLNCQQGVTSQPCLQCASCREIAAGNALDVLEIDAASNTGVDNVREVIINNIAIAPARDRYKVFVIDEVHMLSNSAFNALLKTLEEPPPHVVFIMATTELHKLPETILSRCQQFEFRQIPTEKIFRRLRAIAEKEGVKIADAALREVARAGAGSLRDAQSALDQVIAFSGADIKEEDVITALGLVSARTLSEFSAAIAAQETAKVINLVAEVVTRGYDLRNFIRELLAYFRHLLVIKSGIDSSDVLGVADVEVEKLRQLAKRFSEEDLVRIFHLLAATEKEVKDSPQPRFQLEIGLVKLTHAVRLRSLAELLKRLEALETQIGGSNNNSVTSEPAAVNNLRSNNKVETSAKPTTNTTAQPAAKTNDEPAPVAKQSVALKLAATPEAAPEEPPDFPDWEESRPADLDEVDFTPARASRREPARIAAAAPAASVARGRELETIRAELQRLNRQLVLMALEDAQQLSYDDGVLQVTLANDDAFAKRLRDSSNLFREIGQRLLGQPVRVEVHIGAQTPQVNEAARARAQLHERAANNPKVKMLLDKLRGEILEVRENPGQSATGK